MNLNPRRPRRPHSHTDQSGSSYGRPAHSRGSSFGGNKSSSGGGFRSGRPQGGRSFGSGPRRPIMNRQQKNFHPSMFQQKAVLEEIIPYVAKHTFEDFQVDETIKRNIREKGYVVPSPIQDQIIPHVLDGRDVIGLAQTGTGKTAAFLIPIINKLKHNPHLKVLIIAPTRELAVQIEDQWRDFARGMNMSSVLVIGGANIKRQCDQLRRVHHAVIGTPGRLIDLEKRGYLKLSLYSTIVLDEVDRMLDMGFIPDMQYIIQRLPEKHHGLFFSATMPHTLDSVVRSFLTDPVKVVIESQQKSSTRVEQDVIHLAGRQKIEVLHDLLIKEGFSRVLVFGKTKHGINKLEDQLVDRGFKVGSIHGNKSQAQRQRALDAFKDGRINILLATDIASRGLDIDDVTHVINYDLPQSYEDYIHRIGRTGRADKTGVALTFMD